jgi:hypothetical protein
MRTGDDYTEMAQRALRRKACPGRAQVDSLSRRLFARKVFTEKRDIDRNTRLSSAAAKERAGGRPRQPRQAVTGRRRPGESR